MTGNWSGLWENIKAIVYNALIFIWNFIQLWGVGRVLGFFRGFGGRLVEIASGAFGRLWSGITGWLGNIVSSITGKFQSVLGFFGWLKQAFYDAGAGLMDMIIKGITAMIGKVIGAVKSVVQQIRNFLPFSPAKEGPLSDLNKLDFAGPIRDSIMRGLPSVQASLNTMLSVPSITPVSAAAPAGGYGPGPVIQIENMYVRNDEDVRSISRELYNLHRSASRAKGLS